MNFWTLRFDAYRAVKTNSEARKIALWDVLRAVSWCGFFCAGLWLSSRLVAEDVMGDVLRFVVAATTFGTFLASFVLSVMNATGKRELSLATTAIEMNAMADRLRWLLSDQLIMVVSALLTAACGLLWLAFSAISEPVPQLVVALAVAFLGLSLVNALRLPFQIWELQSSVISDERARTIERINKENAKRFGD